MLTRTKSVILGMLTFGSSKQKKGAEPFTPQRPHHDHRLVLDDRAADLSGHLLSTNQAVRLPTQSDSFFSGSSEESVGWNLIFQSLGIQLITVYFNENATVESHDQIGAGSFEAWAPASHGL